MIMGLFTKTAYKPADENERKIEELIIEFCKNNDTRIIVNAFGHCYLTLEDKHYDIVIKGNYITIANTTMVSRDWCETSFIEHLTKIVHERATKDMKKVLTNIEERKNSLLDRIIEDVKLDDQLGGSTNFD